METQEEINEEVQGEVPPVEDVPPPISPEVAERAKMMGHIPKEEFRGDPERWVPADKYVERAESLMPILRSQLGKYENEITSLKATVESQKKTTEKMLKMSEKTEKLAFERAKKSLQQQQAQAVADGDVDKWQRLEDEKDKLPPPEKIEAEPIPQNPIYDQWAGRNEWINNDPDMSLYANSYGHQLQSQNPNLAYTDILDAVEKKVKEIFPNKFENPNRSQATPVDGGTSRTAPVAEKKQTYNSLSAEEKAVCNQNVSDGLYKSKEDWVKVYFEED